MALQQTVKLALERVEEGPFYQAKSRGEDSSELSMTRPLRLAAKAAGEMQEVPGDAHNYTAHTATLGTLLQTAALRSSPGTPGSPC